jgi:hypothetical protein
MSDVRRITLDEVVRHFEELEDPHSAVDRKHPLPSVVVIAVMTVLALADGADGHRPVGCRQGRVPGQRQMPRGSDPFGPPNG